jgi:hypothetical protein
MANDILSKVASYYGSCLQNHGATPRGVDWKDQESQDLRFAQLLRVVDRPSIAVSEIGCGFGSLVDFLTATGQPYTNHGYDIVPARNAAARERHAAVRNATFTQSLADLPQSDYAVASGLFNVKLGYGAEEWLAYVLETIDVLASKASVGFAFNALSQYSDPDKRRPDLYYADPQFHFDRLMKRYPRRVALLHDYGLYEFTILVRK